MTKLRSREVYEEAIRNSLSIAQVCRYLHIKPVGGNYRTIHQAIDLYNIDTSHFTGQGWNSGERYSPVVKKFPLRLQCLLSVNGLASLSCKQEERVQILQEAQNVGMVLVVSI